MILGRILGWLCLGLALLALGQDGLRALETSQLSYASLGEFWLGLEDMSLPAIQRLFLAWLPDSAWDPGMMTLLRLPAAPILGALALLLLVIFRKRPEKRRARFGALAR
jgi:hypothetical protein